MSLHLCISIRFLDRVFHGRRDGEAPEWPPSPLRVFQALVASSARSTPDPTLGEGAVALRWLEALEPPVILAPAASFGTPVRTAVPNNDLDLVAAAWSKGKDPAKQPNELKTMKTVRPTWILGQDAAGDAGAVHYLWTLPDCPSGDVERFLSLLDRWARSIAALGWGIDMATGHGRLLSEQEIESLGGERWSPGAGAAGGGLRVAAAGTLDALLDRHSRFVARLDDDRFTAPPPLSGFRVVAYRRSVDPPRSRFAAFSILKLDASGFRSFDPARRGLTLAGMLRHATRQAAHLAHWSDEEINGIILGHESSGSSKVLEGNRRFAYLPLPSIEFRGEGSRGRTGGIRRALVASFDESCQDEIGRIRRFLSGTELLAEPPGTQASAQPVALLSVLPSTDRTVRRYVAPASSWASVTPVVSPGFDDPAHYRRRLKEGVPAEEQKILLGRLQERTSQLLRKAIRQAGFPDELAAHADLEWSRLGFWAGLEPADRYGVPGHLRRFPRYHLQVRWRDARGNPVQVPGPICIGGGRFYGLGLLARQPEPSGS